MEQTVLKDQTIQFEDEDQVIESQSISILPPQTEEKSSLLEDSVTPEEETKNGVSTKIPRAKKYLKITDEQRRDFIDAVENKGEKIIHAAKLFDINYSSAKSILNIYKNEGRSTKKGTRTKTDNVSPKILETSEGLGSLPKTASVSTQTNEEDHQDSFLLLKDNLLLGSEKRSNPYDSISYHGVSRFTGNINDYSGSQLQNNFNQLPGFQNIIDPNNKPPQDYQPNQPIFTSINYISLPSAQNISAPNLQHPSQLSSLNPENNSLFKPAGFLYPQNTQALSPESGPPQLNQNLPGLNLLTSYGINQPLFSNNPQSLPTNLDYSQLQGFNLPSSGSLRQEVPLQNKEDYSSGLKNFASMSYTGGDNTMGQAQISQHQLPLQFNENNKGLFQQGKTEIRYLPPISMVYMPMPSNQYEQQNATIRPVFQMIGNYAPQQNTFAFYENNQNSNSNNQNHNNYPQNN